jgi:hypothetical protein
MRERIELGSRNAKCGSKDLKAILSGDPKSLNRIRKKPA